MQAKFILITTFIFLTIMSGLYAKKTDIVNHDIPITPIKISCINMAYVKGMLVISSQDDYQQFLRNSSAASIIGYECSGYNAPQIDFSMFHLILIHEGCGGCEDPEIAKSFFYNSTSDTYDYILTLKQKGICKMANHFFEKFLVKRTHIDISKLNYKLIK